LSLGAAEAQVSKSVRRVELAAAELGLAIEVRRLGNSRTAEDAARACGCAVGQIVKSLVFRGRRSGALVLLLVSGANRVDPELAGDAAGEPLDRADAAEVRERTGFAIGGVAPIGHLEAPRIWIDRDLMRFDTVWAAAGAPDAVFAVAPADLVRATGAKPVELAAR
jgi:prolyl-tRNA editing enzyme YbaK/EbsC (Cys-tRNA(Pro) deacylase)